MKLGPSDVFLQKAPISFDASVQELFNSLACGGVLLLAAPGGEKDTQYLARLCKEQRVTCCSVRALAAGRPAAGMFLALQLDWMSCKCGFSLSTASLRHCLGT